MGNEVSQAEGNSHGGGGSGHDSAISGGQKQSIRTNDHQTTPLSVLGTNDQMEKHQRTPATNHIQTDQQTTIDRTIHHPTTNITLLPPQPPIANQLHFQPQPFNNSTIDIKTEPHTHTSTTTTYPSNHIQLLQPTIHQPTIHQTTHPSTTPATGSPIVLANTLTTMPMRAILPTTNGILHRTPAVQPKPIAAIVPTVPNAITMTTPTTTPRTILPTPIATPAMPLTIGRGQVPAATPTVPSMHVSTTKIVDRPATSSHVTQSEATQLYLDSLIKSSEAETHGPNSSQHDVVTLRQQLATIQEVTRRHQQQQQETAERIRRELQAATAVTMQSSPESNIDPFDAFLEEHRAKKPRVDGPATDPSNNLATTAASLDNWNAMDYLIPTSPGLDDSFPIGSPFNGGAASIDPPSIDPSNLPDSFMTLRDSDELGEAAHEHEQEFDPDQLLNDESDIIEVNHSAPMTHPPPTTVSQYTAASSTDSSSSSFVSDDTRHSSITLRGRVIQNEAGMSRVFLNNFLDSNILGAVEKAYQIGQMSSDGVRQHIMMMTTVLEREDQEELLLQFSRINLNSAASKETSIVAKYTFEQTSDEQQSKEGLHTPSSNSTSPIAANRTSTMTQPNPSTSSSLSTTPTTTRPPLLIHGSSGTNVIVNGGGTVTAADIPPKFRLDLPKFAEDMSLPNPREDDPDGVARIRLTMIFSQPTEPKLHQDQKHKRKKSISDKDGSADGVQPNQTDEMDLVTTVPTPAASTTTDSSLAHPVPSDDPKPLFIHRMCQANRAFERLSGYTQLEIRDQFRQLGQRLIFKFVRSDHLAAFHKILTTWRMNHMPEGHMSVTQTGGDAAKDNQNIGLYHVRVDKYGRECYCLVHLRVIDEHGVFMQGVQSIMPLPDDPLRPPPPFIPGIDLSVETLLYGYRPPSTPVPPSTLPVSSSTVTTPASDPSTEN